MRYLRGVARATMRMRSAAVFGYGPKTILSRRIYPPADRDTDDADRMGSGGNQVVMRTGENCGAVTRTDDHPG